jgi:anti-sigma regulatory factor (Ser/Thr protein kinase)
VTEAPSRGTRRSARSALDLSLPAVPGAVPHMRGAAAQFAAEHGAPEDLAFDISLVVSEAVTNAVKYAYEAGSAGTVELTASVEDGFLALAVRDQGAGFGSGSSDGLGLGLTIIARLSAEMTVVQAGEGTEVRMRFALPSA